MHDEIKREGDLKIGKKYKISWGEEFSIQTFRYYIDQGFRSDIFCEVYDKVIDKKKSNSKFEFLGMFCEDSINFYKKFAKVKVLDNEILIPHTMLLR